MRKHTLTKTNYLQYLSCPEELWLKKNRPDLIPKLDVDALHKIEQGNLVDRLAQEWFRGGCILDDENIDPNKVAFQVRAEWENLIAVADIIVYGETDKHIQLFEAKAATSLKQEHLHDIAYQKYVFEKAGYTITDTYLLHVNKEYNFIREIDQCELLTTEKITATIEELSASTQEQVQAALNWVHGDMPKERITVGCPKKLSCPFVQYHFDNLPAATIYNIPNIQTKKLQAFMDAGILDLQDVPPDFPLSDKQRRAVDIAQQDTIVIRTGPIKRALKKLEYPLYFIDYESFSYIIPAQDFYRPYQQMVFQYSLHTQSSPDAEIVHTEYLLKSKKESVTNLLAHMRAHIGDTGSVIVWNQSFEKARNSEMAAIYPAYRDFLLSINERLFDLMQIFKQGHYIHPGFKGRNSLKSVLPTLCPDISYDELSIQNGGLAAIKWHHATDKRVSSKEAEEIFSDLLKYCHLDTLAMVKILEKVRLMIA